MWEEKMICNKCKTALLDTAKFCPKCGDRVELKQPQENQAMKCPQCGAENPVTAKFCKVDGYNLQQGQMAQSEKRVTTKETLICPVCGTENLLTAKFCKKDGTLLTKPESPAMQTDTVQAPEAPENKPVVKPPKPSLTIKCPQCGAENLATAKFCKVDGYSLQQVPAIQEEKKDLVNDTVSCPACGTSNPATAKFCKKDGVSLQRADISFKDQPAEVESVKPEAGLEKQDEVKTERDDVLPPREDLSKTPELLQEKNTVICPTCGTENPAASKYCKKDGTPLQVQSSNGVTTGTATKQPAKEIKKNRDFLHPPSVVVGAQEKRSNKWIWFVLVAVMVIACVAGGAFYYLGYIGMNPSRVQKIINNDLRSKGFSVSVIVDDKWIAKMEGTVNDNNDKQTAFNIVKSNKYIKDVVDNIISPPVPTTNAQKPTDEKPSQSVDEPKPSISLTPSVATPKPSTPSLSTNPDAVRKSVNSSLKKKGLYNVYLEVNQDMQGVLKGYVYGAADKTSAMSIARANKGLKNVEDNIEVRQVPIPKSQTVTVDPAKLEGDINRAVRNAGISGVNAEVKDDMSVLLKGSVRSNDDKQRVMQIVNGFRQIKNIKDLIFVVGS
jgi:predicted RNA-binding Zn-ribbon protein involved in translation (DUF1610 family)/osmotically-inducible protein OsmY